MTEDHYKRLVALLLDTIALQQQENAALASQVRSQEGGGDGVDVPLTV